MVPSRSGRAQGRARRDTAHDGPSWLADPFWRTDLVVIGWCLLMGSPARPKCLGEQDYASLFRARPRAHSPRRNTSRGAEPYRVFRRFLILEGWSHDQAHTPVFS